MQLMERDFEIIQFVLVMKFASATDIHQKFFKRKKDGGLSTNEWYARERLRQLIEMGYLTTVRYRFEQKNYYIGTKNGFDLIRYMQPHWEPCKPIQHIDIRTFDHDVQVTKSRLLIEEYERGTQGTSDRQLKCEFPDYFRKGGRDNSPDGTYTSAAGKKIAFEFEIAQKSKQRYRDKIRAYISSFRTNNTYDQPKYDHIRIICQKKSVFDIYRDEVVLFKDFFTIEMADSFFANFQPCLNKPIEASFHPTPNQLQ